MTRFLLDSGIANDYMHRRHSVLNALGQSWQKAIPSALAHRFWVSCYRESSAARAVSEISNA